jgi:hypothetical protein
MVPTLPEMGPEAEEHTDDFACKVDQSKESTTGRSGRTNLVT